MGKSLSGLKRKEIRGIVIGTKYETNQFDIEEIIKSKYKSEYTIIYNPNSEQREQIYDHMKNNGTETVDGKDVSVEMGDFEIIKYIVPIITDIEADFNNNEDVELLKEALLDGDLEFQLIRKAINEVWTETLMYYFNELEIKKNIMVVEDKTNKILKEFENIEKLEKNPKPKQPKKKPTKKSAK